mgnify:CR=1 FL=1
MMFNEGLRMNHPNGSEAYRSDLCQSSPVPPLSATAWARMRRDMPTPASLSFAAEAIAEDPLKVCLAGGLISCAATGTDVRFEKFAAVRQAIEAGTYYVSSADLAEKLMQSLYR